MASGGSVEKGSNDLAQWCYFPRPPSLDRREASTAFLARLASAVRSAHALGVAFDLVLESGGPPRLWLETRGTSAARWVGRVLLRAYGTDLWRRSVRLPPTPPVSVPWVAERIRPWPEPLYGTRPAAPLVDLFALTLSSVGPGFTLRCGFEPLPEAPLHRRLPWELPADGARTARVHDRGRRPNGLPAPWEEIRPAPPDGWRGRVVGSGAGDPTASRGVARALERASRGEGGYGLRFRAGRWRLGLRLPSFLACEAEVVGWLPGLDTPATGSGAVPGLPLALGRDAHGCVFGPTLEPTQGRHLAILGETGMGKSSMLVALVHRVARRSGVVLLDPLGETVRSLEAELDPSVLGRTLLVSPQRRPRGINALEGIGPAGGLDPVRAEHRLDDLVFALRAVRRGRYTTSGFWGPRLEEMLGRALRAAAAWPDGTLADAHSLLESGGVRPRPVPEAGMAAVRELAERIRDRPEDGEGARRLLHEVVRSPVLEKMLCARSPEISTRDLVSPGRVVLVSGDASFVGASSARYLLSVYLAILWSELLARSSQSKTFVVLDEAQWFAHESLAEMLRLGRRANVHVVLATQSVGSLPDDVAEAVWTNVADFVTFRGAPEEARQFARIAREGDAEAIVSLPRGQALAVLAKGFRAARIRTVRRVPSPADTGRESGPLDPSGTDRPGASASGPERAARSGEPPAGVPGPAERSSKDGEAIGRLLRGLTSTLASDPDSTVVRVALDDLRRSSGSDERTVREIGARLGRSGALVARERTDRGTVWVLSVERLRAHFGPVVGEPGGTAGSAGNERATDTGS